MDTMYFRDNGKEFVEYDPNEMAENPTPLGKTTIATKKGIYALATTTGKSIAKTAKREKASVSKAVERAKKTLGKVAKSAKKKIAPKRKPKPKTIVEELLFFL